MSKASEFGDNIRTGVQKLGSYRKAMCRGQSVNNSLPNTG